MKNTIYTDADLNAKLLRGEEYDGNTIEIVIDADNTADQELTIAAGTTTITETITSGTRNTVEIPRMIWNFGGVTTVTLSKNGTDAETITLIFPAAIDVDAGAALNETETANEYRMDGSQSLQQQIVSLQEQMQTFSMQTLDYILPKTISQADIADGSSNTALVFEFEVTDENGSLSLFTSVQFLAGTTVTGTVYDDLNVTGSIALDGNAIATILHTYRDGRQLFTLDYLIQNLSKGNHNVTVSFEADGGSMTVIQFLSAFMLAAKSTGSQYSSVQDIFSGGKWAAGVLADGLDESKMTESAMLSGVENTIIKYALPTTPTGENRDVSNLDDYYLSSYILCNGLYFAEPFYLKDGYFRKQGTHGLNNSTINEPVGNTSTYFWIPIKRISGFNTLQYESKTVKYNGVYGSAQDYNITSVGVGAIVNGSMQERRAAASIDEQTWTTHTLDISDLPYVDYILLFGVDGSPAYRNIKLLRSF